MPRYAYKPSAAFPSRLLAADTRPIENDKTHKLALVRLEFEVFWRHDRDRELRSLGQIASRDLVIGPDAARDNGVAFFAQRLGVRDSRKPESWSARADEGAWVEIIFGAVDERDGRNRFAEVGSFSPDGYAVVEYRYELSENWVKAGEAAAALKVSASTIRRRLEKHFAEYGEDLERRTSGDHRLINLVLLRHLLRDPIGLDVSRIESAQRIRELQKENAELRRRLGGR